MLCIGVDVGVTQLAGSDPEEVGCYSTSEADDSLADETDKEKRVLTLLTLFNSYYLDECVLILYLDFCSHY